MMSEKKTKLGSLLMQYGLISEEDLNEGLELQKLMGLKLGETLAKIGKLSGENVQWVLSKQFDIPFIIIEHIKLEDDLIVKLPKNFLVENRILPLFQTDEEIYIVTEDIFNYSAFAFIENNLNKKVNISIGDGKKIEQILIKFFKKEVVPSLISILQNIINKIKDTSFYRIDIFIREHSCEVSIYGSGILKKVAKIDIALKKEDVFRTFDSLNIPFMYDIFDNSNGVIFSVYPLINKIENVKYPSILGLYGLILPYEPTFADMRSSEMEHLLYCDRPFYGYPYIAIKGKIRGYKKIIYLPDSAPQEFSDYYIKMYAPEKCGFCNTDGCDKCRELGYTFKLIEGCYSSDELKKLYIRI